MMNHYNKTWRTYSKVIRANKKRTGCPFCTVAENEKILDSNETMNVVANLVAYDLFEGFRVVDHMLIAPKRHRSSIAEFSDQETVDYMKLVAKYEQLSYSIYSRGVGSAARSLAHQHTHLIKLSQQASSFILFSKKPYLLIEKSSKR